ncbi:MAG: hypothetical protein KDA80_01855 [Planctomycetaceae bacterium]|nr:hypothetical protein [Planctomycetaceae bacterium]
MKKQNSSLSFGLVQVVVIAAFGASWAFQSVEARSLIEEEFLHQEPFVPVSVPRNEPLRVQPLYDRPDWITDEDLAAVLLKIQPPFSRKEMKPNHVEHALRTWGIDATFQNPEIVSGQEMLEFLTDSAKFMESWGEEVRPFLEDKPGGVEVKWGPETGRSYHHDHWLACVTEAGATLDTPVYAPSRRHSTLNDVLQEAMRDFRLDEREIEWTAMGFGLWISPHKTWIGSGGRKYSFDLIVDRLMRGHKVLGVCVGTHRVYSLMLLIRLDDEFDILSDSAREQAYAYLESIRDLITASQFEDGHWSEGWHRGAEEVTDPTDGEFYRSIIATGHHLEWLSIAPPELHPPEEKIKKAVDWIIDVTKQQTRSDVKTRFTFLTHVGSALCNWRQVRPADFWRDWQKQHPWDPSQDEPEESEEEAALESH